MLYKCRSRAYKCPVCGHRFIRTRVDSVINNKRAWFERWMIEGYSIRQLMKYYDQSRSTLDRIIHYWLDRDPPQLKINYSVIRHIVIDGTYFHKRPQHKNNPCLILLIDSDTHKPIYWEHTEDGESYKSVYALCLRARELGLSPLSITTDGHINVIRAIRAVWSNAVNSCESRNLFFFVFFPLLSLLSQMF